MNTKYRKPITNIRDRHVLIELDGDFTDNEMRHILNHAYLNHKAPHEYDEAKKYIRDLVIGKHNSVYIMYNGVPQPLASASIFYPGALSGISSNYDLIIAVGNSVYCGTGVAIAHTNNGTCTSIAVNQPSGICIPFSLNSTSTYGYDNGTALAWELLYTNTQFTSIQPTQGGGPSGTLVVGPYAAGGMPHAGIKYGYASYLTSNNPLTLSTYYYWEAPSASFSYVYFNLYVNASVWTNDCSICNTNVGGQVVLIPIFYSQGNYSFNSGSYYITMWQWTYT